MILQNVILGEENILQLFKGRLLDQREVHEFCSLHSRRQKLNFHMENEKDIALLGGRLRRPLWKLEDNKIRYKVIRRFLIVRLIEMA